MGKKHKEDKDEEIRSVCKWIRIAPRKLRVIANEIRGKNVKDAFTILDFMVKRGVTPIRKVVHSALASAKQKTKIEDPSSFIIKRIFVDQGPALKRGKTRARGMWNRIHKYTSHVTVVLETNK